MNRTARTPAPQAADDDTDESSTQRIVPAAGTRWPPTTAPNSVFDAGRKAHAASQPARVLPAAIVIRSGVPVPLGGRPAVGYRQVIVRMQPGQSVVLPLKQARGFYASAKKHGAAVAPPQSFVFRTLDPETGAIWRTE